MPSIWQYDKGQEKKGIELNLKIIYLNVHTYVFRSALEILLNG